jgi:uncharacterized coiled-coil protein SlyX
VPVNAAKERVMHLAEQDVILKTLSHRISHLESRCKEQYNEILKLEKQLEVEFDLKLEQAREEIKTLREVKNYNNEIFHMLRSAIIESIMPQRDTSLMGVDSVIEELKEYIADKKEGKKKYDRLIRLLQKKAKIGLKVAHGILNKHRENEAKLKKRKGEK